eukprot:2030829-Pleurochrysis_carterae.AAC.1
MLAAWSATVALQRGVASASRLGWPNETENDKWGTTTWAAVKCSRKGAVGRGSSSVAQACATHKTQARMMFAAQRRRLDLVDVGSSVD